MSLAVENLSANVQDVGSTLVGKASPGEGNDSPCQYFAREIPWTESLQDKAHGFSQKFGHYLAN